MQGIYIYKMIKGLIVHIRKIVLLSIGIFPCIIYSQQEAQYTQYMYMTQVFNPAYAGNRGIMSLKALARKQWIDIEGAPTTAVFTFDTPIGEAEKVGLGLSIINDQIGPLTETNIAIDYAYSLSFMFSKLTFGLKVGLNSFDINFDRLNIYDETDPYIGYAIDNQFQPQIGVGVYFNTEKFYLGLSAPNLLKKQYFDLVESESSFFSSLSDKIHFYLIGGYVFDVLPSLKFKPASLIKVVNGSPIQWDFSFNFLLNDNFSFGVANRLDSAITALAGIQVSNGAMIGFSYDFSTTEIKKYATGSFEVFFRIDIGANKKILTPRFF